MLLLGLCAVLSDQYYVTSNRESGDGRFDIQLKPKDPAMPGVLIEVKAAKDQSREELVLLAEKALHQIMEQKNDTELISSGVKTVLKYGIAFCGKRVEIAVE